MIPSFIFMPMAACALVLVSVCTSAHAQAEPAVRARFQQEMLACRDGSSSQGRTDCEREARAARGEARRGSLNDAPSTSYAANALRRCEVFAGQDLSDCEARMGAQARTKGSVEQGGVLREAPPNACNEPAQTPGVLHERTAHSSRNRMRPCLSRMSATGHVASL